MNTVTVTLEQLLDLCRGDHWEFNHVLAEQFIIVDRINAALAANDVKLVSHYVEERLVYRIQRKAETDARELEHITKYSGIVPHVADTIELGAILYSSWGYEQTNIDFYCVVEMSKAMVKILPLTASITPSGECSMAGSKTAEKTLDFSDEILKKKIQASYISDGKPWLKIASYAHAWLWDGREKYVSWYA
jgi:hypothetical protein